MREPVTIIIPHYRAEVLHDCLESLFRHSDWPIRVLVVDDGPDAPSIRLAREKFSQIEILRNERNVGFCASCNHGLEMVSRYGRRAKVSLSSRCKSCPGS